MHERPLVAFTLLTQAAVGAFGIERVRWNQAGGQAAGAWLDGALAVIGLLYGAGMLASFFHLGSPGRAWRALNNLRSSWLSREILFSGSFGLLAACFAVLQWAGVGSWQGRGCVALAACLAGRAWCMMGGFIC
jgi:anaerobic dimethyl sulfoxide reductase subunit C (anchor subunit)